MYFLADNKVYLSEVDAVSKLYREVIVIKSRRGLKLKVLDTGVSTKPRFRQAYTKAEIEALYMSKH